MRNPPSFATEPSADYVPGQNGAISKDTVEGVYFSIIHKEHTTKQEGGSGPTELDLFGSKDPSYHNAVSDVAKNANNIEP